MADRLQKEHHCIVPDLPGHGQNTSMEHVPDYPDIMAGFEQLRLSLELSAWHVAGYSMGGRFALAYALIYPERVRSLTMISASPGIEDRGLREARRMQDEAWAQRFEHDDARTVLHDWYRQGVFSSLAVKTALREEIIQRRGQGEMILLADALRKWGQGVAPSVWGRLNGLNIPSLWVSGEEDPAYMDISRLVATRLGTARLATIPGAGHAVHLENPDGLVHSMQQFLNEHS